MVERVSPSPHIGPGSQQLPETSDLGSRQAAGAGSHGQYFATRGSEVLTKDSLNGKVRSFLERVTKSSGQLVMILAGVKFSEDEGQRCTQIAREILELGIPVLMAYFRWPGEYDDPIPVMKHPLAFQLPLDLLHRCRNVILSAVFPQGHRRTCFMEFPHPETFQLVNELNAAGWHTVYDIIDDWEAFHRQGEAPWYEPVVEEYLCLNVGSLTAVTPELVEAFQKRFPSREVQLVPNGVRPEAFLPRGRPSCLERGEITAGYFGYLSQTWFDWDLVLATAEEHSDWELHIIGYGDQPAGPYPRNLHFHGKVHHHELPSYTAMWDVGIVPFKESRLSRLSDPIKVYEYLELRLPVVVTGVPHVSAYPGVRVANSRDSFAHAIELEAHTPFPLEEVALFLESCTWRRRALALLECTTDLGLPSWTSQCETRNT